MPQIFLPASVAGIVLVWGAGTSELVSQFLTKGINSCIAELVSPWGDKGFGVSNFAVLLMSLLLSYFFNFTGYFL